MENTDGVEVMTVDEQKVLESIRRMGIKLADKKAELKDLMDTIESLKTNINDAMELIHIDELNIPLGADVIQVKQHKRAICKLDKEELAKRAGSSITELNYAGIAHLVEDGTISASDVDGAHKEHTYSFVTTRCI